MKNKKVYVIAIITLLIDFACKLVITNLLELNSGKVIIKNFFNLTYIGNTGGAFGVFQDSTLLLVGITIVFLILFIYFLEKNKITNFEKMCYGLMLGGILGNLVDRSLRGYVVDFLSFKIFGYDFPVFNLADSFIVIGLFLLIIYNIRTAAVNERK